jgi:hypothetical protein
VAQAAIEAAYDAIMMKQLTLRMKGQVTGGFAINKELAFADSKDYVPWRPRVAKVGTRDALINLALFCLFAAWGVLSPSPGMQPMTIGMVAFFFRVNAKMCELFPSPPDRDAAKVFEAKRMLRTIGLVLGSIAAGICAVVAAPALVSSAFALPMPVWVLLRQEALVNVATCAAMAYTATYFR